MAPHNGNTTQTLLHLHILFLVKLLGSSTQLKEYLKPGIFSKPNRVAFEHVMHFLINAYDPQLCRSAITCWPIVERKTQERIFRREIVAAYGKVAAQETDFGLPAFSNSFHSSPGGGRLETFLCKLACVTMRNVLERRSGRFVPNLPRGLRPQKCLLIARAYSQEQLKAVRTRIQRFLFLMTNCAETARCQTGKLVSNKYAIKASLSVFGLNESIAVEDIFNEEIEQQLRERLQNVIALYQGVKNQEKLVASCENAVRMLIDDQHASAVLESEEYLDIAVLLKQTAEAVEARSARFFPSTSPEVLPQLQSFSEKLAKILRVMEKNLASVVELAATTTASAQVATSKVGTPEKFRHACQLLEDANHATPPLEFRPAAVNPAWQTISADTESPPITNVADLLCTQKSTGANGTVVGRRPLVVRPPSQATPKMLVCTPARPRSEIPVKTASRSSRAVIPNAYENTQIASVTSRLLPKAGSAELSSNHLRPSKVSNGNEIRDISSKSELKKEDSAQNVLDLAVSVLSPVPSKNTSLKEEVTQTEGAESPRSDKLFAPLKFSESMRDSPVKKILCVENEKMVPEKKTVEMRKSILDLIERYRGIVPVSEKTEASTASLAAEAEPEEWKESDLEISFDSDIDVSLEENEYTKLKFQLSPGF